MKLTPAQYAALPDRLKPPTDYTPAPGIAPPPVKVRTFPHPPASRPAPRKSAPQEATIATVAPGGLFFVVLKAAGLPLPTPEFKFNSLRRWRFDYAWQEQRLALECQGGIWTQGRHTRGAALLKEWEKLNTAACQGWRVLFCQPANLHKPETISTIRAALGFPA